VARDKLTNLSWDNSQIGSFCWTAVSRLLGGRRSINRGRVGRLRSASSAQGLYLLLGGVSILSGRALMGPILLINYEFGNLNGYFEI